VPHRSSGEPAITVERLIDAQRRCSVSANPLERSLGSLIIAARLQRKLAALSDSAIGHLMFTHVWNELNLLSPEMTICQAATERLRNSSSVVVTTE